MWKGLATVASLIAGAHAGAQVAPCDSSAISLKNGRITVSPSSDDAANLQCVFEEAVANEYPVIELSAGEFNLSREVVVNEYEGAFTGAGMERTTIRTGGHRIHLRSSNISVSSMSLSAAPRLNSTFFTIGPVEYDCNKRVTRTTVDRVRMEWVPEDGVSYDPDNTFYINAGPYPPCRDRPLLGYLSVNRSEFRGADVGNYIMGYGGGAKVEFTNNTFWGGAALTMFGYRRYEDNPLNINFTFTGNHVTSVSNREPAIFIGFGDFGVDASTLHISRNRFTQEKLVYEPRDRALRSMIDVRKLAEPLLSDKYNVALTIVANTFDRSDWVENDDTGQSYRPSDIISIRYIDSGVVSGNRFVCNYGRVLELIGDRWAIAGNEFRACRNIFDETAGELRIFGDNNVDGANTY